MPRLLILACSATKRHDEALMKALDRYDGPSFRTLRKALREMPEEQRPTVLILSALYGLIPADELIADYDKRMKQSESCRWRSQVRSTLVSQIHNRRYDQTFINLGADYMPALAFDETIAECLGTVQYAEGGIGDRLGQMRRWLIGTVAQPL